MVSAVSPPPRHVAGLLDPLAHLLTLRFLKGGYLGVATVIGVSECRRDSKSAPPRKTTFTETS